MPKLALEKPSDPLRTKDPRYHRCGACGAWLFTARFVGTGTLVHVEKDAPVGDLVVVPELPGVPSKLPHVSRTRQRVTDLREHDCPNVRRRSFSADATPRKVRP